MLVFLDLVFIIITSFITTLLNDFINWRKQFIESFFIRLIYITLCIIFGLELLSITPLFRIDEFGYQLPTTQVIARRFLLGFLFVITQLATNYVLRKRNFDKIYPKYLRVANRESKSFDKLESLNMMPEFIFALIFLAICMIIYFIFIIYVPIFIGLI